MPLQKQVQINSALSRYTVIAKLPQFLSIVLLQYWCRPKRLSMKVS